VHNSPVKNLDYQERDNNDPSTAEMFRSSRGRKRITTVLNANYIPPRKDRESSIILAMSICSSVLPATAPAKLSRTCFHEAARISCKRDAVAMVRSHGVGKSDFENKVVLSRSQAYFRLCSILGSTLPGFIDSHDCKAIDFAAVLSVCRSSRGRFHCTHPSAHPNEGGSVGGHARSNLEYH
jgi:hypothetical protein